MNPDKEKFRNEGKKRGDMHDILYGWRPLKANYLRNYNVNNYTRDNMIKMTGALENMEDFTKHV